MTPIQHVIIGSGQLGLAIMDELVASGQPVKLVSRSGNVSDPLPEGVTLAQGNAYDAARIAAA